MLHEFKVGRKVFKVDVDLDELSKEAREHLDEYEKGFHINIDTEDQVSEEQYKESVKVLVNYVENLKLYPQLLETLVVDKIAKKKDGWFAKGRVNILHRCDNAASLSEEEYGYRCLCLKAKSMSADTVNLFITDGVFKW